MRRNAIAITLLLCLAILLSGCVSSDGISLSDYNRLRIGMSYSGAMNIVGEYATRTSEIGAGQSQAVTYTVRGQGFGAVAFLVFSGSPLTLFSKSQANLS